MRSEIDRHVGRCLRSDVVRLGEGDVAVVLDDHAVAAAIADRRVHRRVLADRSPRPPRRHSAARREAAQMNDADHHLGAAEKLRTARRRPTDRLAWMCQPDHEFAFIRSRIAAISDADGQDAQRARSCYRDRGGCERDLQRCLPTSSPFARAAGKRAAKHIAGTAGVDGLDLWSRQAKRIVCPPAESHKTALGDRA